MIVKEATKVALITGGAKRIGGAISEFLQQQGMSVAIHCYTALAEAEQLANKLNAARKNSAIVVQTDLNNNSSYEQLVNQIVKKWGRLDVLVNNASLFCPTPFKEASLQAFDDLLTTNLKAPFFLAQAALPLLQETSGCVINITDVHAQKPLKSYSLYTMSKAALKMMTESLARELAPTVRVNAVAPGAILWPEKNLDLAGREKIIAKIPLKRSGSPLDIAKAVWFLIDCEYITGQTIVVDGGRLMD